MPVINVPLNVPVGTQVKVNIDWLPNNQYGVLDLEHVLIPEGYERDGDTPEEYFRTAKPGELYVMAFGLDKIGVSHENDSDERRIVVRRKTQHVLVVEYLVDAYDIEELVAFNDSEDNLMDVEDYAYGHCLPVSARVEERDAA